MAATSVMDVDGTVEARDGPSLPVYSIHVLQLIKMAQSQHGARYSDYQRYRRYCFSRLRRLHKSLKFLHGRGKFVNRSLDASMVTDVRFLHIPLYNAERAWGYAMELKAIDSGPDLARKRSHLLRRMTKAARWADLFAKLCSERADSRTALEAEAYASYMWGNVLLERESDWETALSKFLRVRAVYEQLGKVGEVGHQVLCRQRVEEMEPTLRYCNYKMGRANMEDSNEALRELSSSQENPALDLLQSKLEAVMEEARSQQAASLTELVWLGRRLPLHSTKTRISILKAQQVEGELGKGTSERQLGLYDKLFMAYQEAKRQVREDMVTAGGAEDVKEELAALDRAVTSLLLQRTLERNLLLVAGARARLERQQQGAKEEREREREKEKEKPAKPEDLIRLYDTLLQNVSDLADIATSGRQQREEDVRYAEELAARKAAFQAARCVYVAQSYAAAQKYAEAYVLYDRAAGEAQEALSSYRQLDQPRPEEEKEMAALAEQCIAQRCLIHVQANMEEVKAQEYVQTKVSKMSLLDKVMPAAAQENQYLSDFLDEYRSALAPGTKLSTTRIAQVPPPFKAVPCRPIVLDTAVNSFEFPSLDERTRKESKKAGTTGWLGGFFGRR